MKSTSLFKIINQEGQSEGKGTLSIKGWRKMHNYLLNILLIIIGFQRSPNTSSKVNIVTLCHIF